jgi:hypothetical protein
MTFPSSAIPEHNQYRVTFFFGPEPVLGEPARSYCVFNVKKRSWKGGVQVSVEIEQDQVNQLRERLGYEKWLTNMLEQTSHEERTAILQRADDLFVQALCACKLDIAMLQGLEQANQKVPAGLFKGDLDQVAAVGPSKVTDYVKAELDLAAEM